MIVVTKYADIERNPLLAQTPVKDFFLSLYEDYGQGTELNSFTLADMGELILLQPEDDFERLNRVYLDCFFNIPFDFVEEIRFHGRIFYHAVVVWDAQFATGFYLEESWLDEKTKAFLQEEMNRNENGKSVREM